MGKKYEAEIVFAEIFINEVYFLKIQYLYNGKLNIIRTTGYLGNPNVYLSSNKCNIYYYRNKVFVGDFLLNKYANYSNNNIKVTQFIFK